MIIKNLYLDVSKYLIHEDLGREKNMKNIWILFLQKISVRNFWWAEFILEPTKDSQETINNPNFI